MSLKRSVVANFIGQGWTALMGLAFIPLYVRKPSVVYSIFMENTANEPTQDTTLLDMGAIRYELHKLLGVPVDVLTPKALPEFFRASVLAEAVLV